MSIHIFYSYSFYLNYSIYLNNPINSFESVGVFPKICWTISWFDNLMNLFFLVIYIWHIFHENILTTNYSIFLFSLLYSIFCSYTKCFCQFQVKNISLLLQFLHRHLLCSCLNGIEYANYLVNTLLVTSHFIILFANVFTSMVFINVARIYICWGIAITFVWFVAPNFDLQRSFVFCIKTIFKWFISNHDSYWFNWSGLVLSLAICCFQIIRNIN